MADSLQGKTFLVTGATEGVGKAAARHFAQHGAKVTVVGRNREKTERVVAELQAATGNADVEFLLGDLSTIAEVRSVADAFRARHDRLDVLVNNAGAVFKTREVTVDGLERTFALNHLSYFQLTVRLLDLLVKTPGARVVSTSSGAHAVAKLELDTIATRARYGIARSYADSKLANVLFTRELARRLAGTGVSANCFHPGWVASGFALNNKGFIARLLSVVSPVLARTPEQGADTLVWLATAPEAAKFNGEYFSDRKLARSSALSKDAALAARLWEMSERLCGLQPVHSAA